MAKSNVFDLKKWLDPNSYLLAKQEDVDDAINSGIEIYNAKHKEWGGNVDRNMTRINFHGGRFVNEIYGTLPGGTALICGAGPSLERNLNTIRKIKDYVLLICVDRAYKILKNAGITPHMVVCSDAGPRVATFISGIKDTTIALSLISHPNTVNAAQGNDIYWHGPINPFSPFTAEWMEKYGERIASCRQGFTVTSIATEIALWIGCDTIITIGNDLAWRSKSDFKQDYNAKHDMIRLKNNMVTIPVFIFAASFNSLYPKWHPDIDFFDASDGLEVSGWKKINLENMVRKGEAMNIEKVS